MSVTLDWQYYSIFTGFASVMVIELFLFFFLSPSIHTKRLRRVLMRLWPRRKE